MKRMLSLCAAALCLTLALTPTALAADFEPAVPNAKVCYPTAIVRGDDGTELKKIYDLSPEDDPAGIPRSDFRQDGFHYTLTDLLKQELPEISTKRNYPNLAEQDTQYLPKTITENGKTLTLTDIQWQTDNTANMDGYAVADRYTAVATYSGSATSSYVKGYTVTADYAGTVSWIALNRVRYVAIFEGTPIQPTEPAETPATASAFRWSYVLIPIGIVAAAGAGVGGALLVKHRKENADEEDTE